MIAAVFLNFSSKLWIHTQSVGRQLTYRPDKLLANLTYSYPLLGDDIDIALVRDVDKPVNNVVPLFRVIEAEPVGIPDWAYEQNLVAC